MQWYRAVEFENSRAGNEDGTRIFASFSVMENWSSYLAREAQVRIVVRIHAGGELYWHALQPA
jgi:hypothetical protein